MSTVFETVIAGVTVFVTGQIIIKFMVEPILELKSLLGKITQIFLRNQGQIISANANQEIEDLIFTLASELLQRRQAILWYKYLSCIYGLPTYKNVLNAAKELNLIGNLVSTQKADEQVKIYNAMAKIEQYLKINISYNK
ncbi:hypothetical protein P4S54_15750 [Shewanella sp. PP-He15 brown]